MVKMFNYFIQQEYENKTVSQLSVYNFCDMVF
jgi:hypothetical protein